MEALTKFGISNSRFTVFVMLALLLLGFKAYFDLSKREDPAVTIRTAVVTVSFPGMAPERVERLIVDPLERTARQIDEVKDINVMISSGSAVLNLNLYESISNEQLDRVFQDIRNKMSNVASELPQGTVGPMVNTNYGDVVIATIAVTGDGYDYAELRDSAKALRKALYSVKGIGAVSLFGVQEERIWLDIDSRKLAGVGVQLSQLLDDLRTQNIILPAGDIDASGTTFNLEANGDLGDIESLKNVLTRVSNDNTLLRLQDLLTVRRGYEEPRRNPVYFDGQPAVMLGVQMSDGQDIQVLGKRVMEAVTAFQDTQPIGISYDYSTYQEVDVTKSIDNALSSVAQTVAVVLLVLLVFLGLRPALIVACIVPFTLMFAIVGIGYLGIDLHVVSIAAVIISLGLLVDNGVVIVEDIQGQLNAGEEPKIAALAASRQFGIPLAVASLTTSAAFIPLLTMEGSSGEYGFSLGAVVAVMLIGSWVTSLYLLPALCIWFAKAKSTSDPVKTPLLVKIYGTLVERALPFSVLIVLGIYGLVVVSASQFSHVKSEMFPLSERAQFLLYVDLPKGTSITETERESLAIEAWLSDSDVNPEIKNTTVYVGDGGPRFYLALNPAETVPSSAFILVNTYDYEGAITAAERARRYLHEQHPQGRFKVKHLSMGGSESGIVEIKVTGPDSERLLEIASRVEAKFSELPDVIQNENDWGNKVIKVVIDVAQDKAREHGVTSRDVSEAMNAYISGSVVSEFREETESIPIVIRGLKEYRDSIEDLEGITIPINNKLVSLAQVATFVPAFELSQMRRENQQRTIKIAAKSASFSAFDMMAYIQPTLDDLELNGAYSYEFGGEIKDSGEVNNMLLTGMVPALLVMLAALVFQFNSARRVSLVFLTVPLVLIGSPVALIITGQPLSFFAMLGLIALAGILINNAIVLIDQIDLERQTMALQQAVVAAAQKRVTPITLTTLTTVVGLLPMAIAGGALFEPMAILMIGGLLLGSIFSLLFVPAAFYVLFLYGDEGNASSTKGALV